MNAYLLKRKVGNGFETIAGLQTISEEIDNEPVSRREFGKKHPLLLEGKAGHHTICGQGVFVGSKSEQETKKTALEGSILPFELSFDNGDRIRANYLITNLVYTGDFNGERNYQIALMSSGEVEVL